jgi:hypothetical protein
MNVLVATKETQGERGNDFCFCEEGELVTFAGECDGEEIDGSCGCRRAMSGVHSHVATTTIKVVEREMTVRQLWRILRYSMIDGGWGDHPGEAMALAQELARIAAHFRAGSVLEKRGDVLQTRRVGPPVLAREA